LYIDLCFNITVLLGMMPFRNVLLCAPLYVLVHCLIKYKNTSFFDFDQDKDCSKPMIRFENNSFNGVLGFYAVYSLLLCGYSYFMQLEISYLIIEKNLNIKQKEQIYELFMSQPDGILVYQEVNCDETAQGSRSMKSESN
jgi:hypothetical protein